MAKDDQPRGKTTPESNSGSFAPKDTPAEEKRLAELHGKDIDLDELRREERKTNQPLTRKPKRGRLSTQQKAIAWAAANKDAASATPRGQITTDENIVGYDADENYADKLTWSRKIKSKNRGSKKDWKK